VLEEGPQYDWLQDDTVFKFAVVMAIGGIVFFWRSFRAALPVVDFSAFKDINFTFGSAFSFVMGIGLYGLTYIYPLYLGRIRGYDSMMIGETLFLSGLAQFIAAPIAGMLSEKVDLRAMLFAGFIGFAGGTFIMMQLTDDWSFNELVWPQILRGASMMFCMVPISNLALGTLPKERVKGASGLFNLMRNLGGAVGLAIINTVLSNRTTWHHERLSESINWNNPAAVAQLDSMTANNTMHGLDGAAAAIKQLGQMVSKQAYVLSFIDVFMLLTLLFAVLAFGTMLMQRPQAVGEGAGH
jgi:DHA2 family multidrug resistance protein